MKPRTKTSHKPKLISSSHRKIIQGKRLALSAEKRKELSDTICQRFIDSVASLQPRINNFKGVRVGIYRSTANELDLALVEKWLHERGAKLCYPRIADQKRSLMVCHPIDDPFTYPWVKNHYGIEEPKAEDPTIEATRIKLFLVPGVIYGRNGERIGSGAGYYDRYLSDCDNALKVALCYHFQIHDNVVRETWDIPIDWLISETADIKTRRFRTWRETPSAGEMAR